MTIEEIDKKIEILKKKRAIKLLEQEVKEMEKPIIKQELQTNDLWISQTA